MAGLATIVPVSPPGPSPVSRQSNCPDTTECGLHIQSQSVGSAGFHPAPLFIRRNTLCVTGIKRRPVRIARPRCLRFTICNQSRNLSATLETRKDEAHGLELVQGGTIVRPVFGLTPHRPFPLEADPLQIFIDRGFEFRPATGLIDILDAQKQSPIFRFSHVGIEDCRQCMTEMQIAIWRRRKAKNGWHCCCEFRR